MKPKAVAPYDPDQDDGAILTVETSGTITTEKPTDVRFRTEWDADFMKTPFHPNCRCDVGNPGPINIVMDEVGHDDQVDAVKCGIAELRRPKSKIHRLMTLAVQEAMDEDDKMQRERRLKGR